MKQFITRQLQVLLSLPVASFAFFVAVLRSRKITALVMVIVFILGIIGGILLPNNVKLALFTGLLDKFSGMEGPTHEITFLQVFWNNISVSELAFLFSIFVIPAWGIVVTNGFILGIFFDFLSRIGQISSLTVFVGGILGLVPHGSLELPAVLSACFLSYLMGIKLYHSRSVMPQLRRMQFIRKSVGVFFVLITPLLLVASVIETNISPYVSDSIARATIAKRNSDPVLAGKLVTQPELQALGIDAHKESLSEVGGKDSLLLTKKLAVFIYDDRVFQGLKTALPDAVELKAYRVGVNSHLVESLSQYDSADTTWRGLALQIDALHVMVESDPGLRLEQTEELTYIVHRGTHTAYHRFGLNGTTLAYITYQGDHPELLKNVMDLQMKKLK